MPRHTYFFNLKTIYFVRQILVDNLFTKSLSYRLSSSLFTITLKSSVAYSYLSAAGEKVKGGVVLGTALFRSLTVGELITINNKFEIHLDINKDYQSYGRCIIDGCIYSTNNYCKSHKTDNSYIYSNNKYGMIYSIFALPNMCLCNNECSCLSLIVFVENVTSTDSCFSS